MKEVSVLWVWVRNQQKLLSKQFAISLSLLIDCLAATIRQFVSASSGLPFTKLWGEVLFVFKFSSILLSPTTIVINWLCNFAV